MRGCPGRPARRRSAMATLVSVNAGIPQDVSWQGKTVHTGAWNSPVHGPRMVRRLNIDGDGQGDLAGHGGDIRAVLVYQMQSYQYWQKQLGRDDLTFGMLGENFTVDGLPDDDVCIGDRYRIGEAEFEVTQPRVTCYRVGMRLGEPAMASLLVAHHRPGFYLRVVGEGRVQAGDEITLTRKGPEELSVADTDALLYLPDRDPAKLRRALNMPALSPGWQQSFRELAAAQQPQQEPGWPGFKTMRVARTVPETPTVSSVYLDTTDNTPLPEARAGQYLSIRLAIGDAAPAVRSYSLSSAPAAAPTASASSASPTGKSAATSMPRSTPGTSWKSPARAARSYSKKAPARSSSSPQGSVPLPCSRCSTNSPPHGANARSGGSTSPTTAPTTLSRTRPTRS
ncbi:MOSC domain-containing protein [Streptomyces sp. NPDC020681]|uniref:MOSC domain-containing protein n=1 Tax=Streptomyces sp. NPDC020681 TaxID=3365083 RepID=UPI0037989F1D